MESTKHSPQAVSKPFSRMMSLMLAMLSCTISKSSMMPREIISLNTASRVRRFLHTREKSRFSLYSPLAFTTENTGRPS